MRIGIDVGGTNTDAVLMDERTVRASCKSPTSRNISDGIVQSISDVLRSSQATVDQIDAVMIGTTQFTNAFVERRQLSRVGIIRLGLPATRGLPSMIDWPVDIADVIGGQFYLVKGGYEFDGRPISPLDESAVASAARSLKEKGIRYVAISGVFSPVKSDMEKRAADIVQEEIPDASVTLSSQIGRISLLERENAGIMNASLIELAQKVVSSFRQALSELGIEAPFYISQNDGTLMTADHVEKYPVLTFASGPTNSMRGAAYLSGYKDALVADIGGTTADLGMLVNGFPRESSVTADIGGVRTNFRMPDILALGLGGGSIVKPGDSPQIGPRSVGYKLTEQALIFGGDTMTATDIAVASGYTGIGDTTGVAHLEPSFVSAANDRIHTMLEEGIDRIKTSETAVPLVLVGGGSILINRKISGTSELVVPENAGVANAVGASIAQVGGEIDKVFSYEQVGRDKALEEARQQAVDVACEAGAQRDTVEVIDIEEIPLSYVTGGAVRLRVKTAGELAI